MAGSLSFIPSEVHQGEQKTRNNPLTLSSRLKQKPRSRERKLFPAESSTLFSIALIRIVLSQEQIRFRAQNRTLWTMYDLQIQTYLKCWLTCIILDTVFQTYCGWTILHHFGESSFQGLLRRCETDFVHPQYLAPRSLSTPAWTMDAKQIQTYLTFGQPAKFVDTFFPDSSWPERFQPQPLGPHGGVKDHPRLASPPAAPGHCAAGTWPRPFQRGVGGGGGALDQAPQAMGQKPG